MNYFNVTLPNGAPENTEIYGLEDHRRWNVPWSVRLGAAVDVRAEGYAGRSWKGRVEEIPGVVQGRRLKPQDPGRPQDTRVLLVKVALLEPTPLKLGQRVELDIGTSEARTP